MKPIHTDDLARAEIEKAARLALTKAGLEEGDPDFAPSSLGPILADRVWRALEAKLPAQARRKKSEAKPDGPDAGDAINLKAIRDEAETQLEAVLRERVTASAQAMVDGRGIEDYGVAPMTDTLIRNIVDEVMPGIRKKDDEEDGEEEEALQNPD